MDKNPENWPGTGRDNKGRFVKGSSGNAGGRPKKPIVLDRLAKEALPELEAIAKDPATPVKVRSDIWRFFYEQKHGKAPQAIDLEGKMENTGTQGRQAQGRHALYALRRTEWSAAAPDDAGAAEQPHYPAAL